MAYEVGIEPFALLAKLWRKRLCEGAKIFLPHDMGWKRVVLLLGRVWVLDFTPRCGVYI
jgi:hypothetical protein